MLKNLLLQSVSYLVLIWEWQQLQENFVFFLVQLVWWQNWELEALCFEMKLVVVAAVAVVDVVDPSLLVIVSISGQDWRRWSLLLQHGKYFRNHAVNLHICRHAHLGNTWVSSLGYSLINQKTIGHESVKQCKNCWIMTK